MADIELVERRRFLIGIGAFALAEGIAGRGLGSNAPRNRVAAQPPSPSWRPVFPWHRTHLGSVPLGVEGCVNLRGCWGPLSWPEAPGSLTVAHPIVQLTSLDGERELRRIRWTGNAIRIPPGEAYRVFVLCALCNERRVNARQAARVDSAVVEARLSMSPSRV